MPSTDNNELNQIVKLLSAMDRARLALHLEWLAMPLGGVVYQPRLSLKGRRAQKGIRARRRLAAPAITLCASVDHVDGAGGANGDV